MTTLKEAREAALEKLAMKIIYAAGDMRDVFYDTAKCRDIAAAFIDEARALLDAPEGREGVLEMEKRKDAAYLERNKVVAALASVFPSGIALTDIPGWSPDWHGCVYIDLPTGQASWHYHDSHAHLFAHLPPYTKPWDGHDTDEKYRRVAALSGAPPGTGEGKDKGSGSYWRDREGW